MVAYDEKTLYSLKRVRTCALVFATVLLCGFLSAAVVIAFLATKENKTLMSVLSVSLSSLSGWGYLTVLFTVIMPRVKRIKLIGKILSYKKTDITGSAMVMPRLSRSCSRCFIKIPITMGYQPP